MIRTILALSVTLAAAAASQQGRTFDGKTHLDFMDKLPKQQPRQPWQDLEEVPKAGP